MPSLVIIQFFRSIYPQQPQAKDGWTYIRFLSWSDPSCLKNNEHTKTYHNNIIVCVWQKIVLLPIRHVSPPRYLLVDTYFWSLFTRCDLIICCNFGSANFVPSLMPNVTIISLWLTLRWLTDLCYTFDDSFYIDSASTTIESHRWLFFKWCIFPALPAQYHMQKPSTPFSSRRFPTHGFSDRMNYGLLNSTPNETWNLALHWILLDNPAPDGPGSN